MRPKLSPSAAAAPGAQADPVNALQPWPRCPSEERSFQGLPRRAVSVLAPGTLGETTAWKWGGPSASPLRAVAGKAVKDRPPSSHPRPARGSPSPPASSCAGSGVPTQRLPEPLVTERSPGHAPRWTGRARGPEPEDALLTVGLHFSASADLHVQVILRMRVQRHHLSCAELTPALATGGAAGGRLSPLDSCAS